MGTAGIACLYRLKTKEGDFSATDVKSSSGFPWISIEGTDVKMRNEMKFLN